MQKLSRVTTWDALNAIDNETYMAKTFIGAEHSPRDCYVAHLSCFILLDWTLLYYNLWHIVIHVWDLGEDSLELSRSFQSAY